MAYESGYGRDLGGPLSINSILFAIIFNFPGISVKISSCFHKVLKILSCCYLVSRVPNLTSRCVIFVVLTNCVSSLLSTLSSSSIPTIPMQVLQDVILGEL